MYFINLLLRGPKWAADLMGYHESCRDRRASLGYPAAMRGNAFSAMLGLVTTLAMAGVARSAPPETPRWPLTLRDGLPEAIPGWAAAPRDPLPEEDENGMGHYVEVSRFFQRIESSTSTKQFRLAVQD